MFGMIKMAKNGLKTGLHLIETNILIWIAKTRIKTKIERKFWTKICEATR